MNLYKVYEVWNSFYYGNVDRDRRDDEYWGISSKRRFSDFIGGFKGDIGDLSSWELTPDQKYKAGLLLGPHSRTMVLIYFLQHPELERPPFL